MAEKNRGMGRGLAAILSVSDRQAVGEEELRSLPVELIAASPSQPRRAFDEQALAGLAESLKARGVLQPVLVRPVAGGTYELIAGERRWRAAKLAGLASIPAIVRAHDDADALELALIENMAREDLNAVEQARACAALVEELGLTQEEVGRRVGRSRVAVSNLLRLLDLPDAALDLLESGALTEGHGRALLLEERPRRAPPAGARGGRAGLVGARNRIPRSRRPPGEDRRRPPRPRGARHASRPGRGAGGPGRCVLRRPSASRSRSRPGVRAAGSRCRSRISARPASWWSGWTAAGPPEGPRTAR